MSARLVPDGLLVEGTCDELGRHAWWVALRAGDRIAGKTGTADRYDSRVGGYSGKTASFVGFAPADDPEIVVSVTLQRPIKGYYGGVVAAPVFHDVMTYALQALQIPPTGGKAPRVRLELDGPPAAADPQVIRDRRSGSGG
jgi:cell division protein FtsI (penicillin-binding protein 3)